MSDWNSIENWLRGWRPRQPAPGIRDRLFPPAAAVAAPTTPAAWATLARWLTPATAFMVLFCLLVSQRTPQFFTMSRGDTPVSLAVASFSNQFYAAYLPASGHSQQNAWQHTRIGWTNDGHIASSMGFFPRAGTNHARW